MAPLLILIFLWWGRREGRDNSRGYGWLSKVEWEFVSQSEAVYGLHRNHTASHTQTSRGELQKWRVQRESLRFQSGSTDTTLTSFVHVRFKHL